MQARRVLVILATVAMLVAVGCGGDDNESSSEGGAATETATATATPTETATATETPESGGTEANAQGKQLFTTTCGGCHTLADAGTSGAVGPNLDDLKPSKDLVEQTIEQGPGQMPANLLQGDDREAVAEYVSSAAGS